MEKKDYNQDWFNFLMKYKNQTSEQKVENTISILKCAWTACHSEKLPDEVLSEYKKNALNFFNNNQHRVYPEYDLIMDLIKVKKPKMTKIGEGVMKALIMSLNNEERFLEKFNQNKKVEKVEIKNDEDEEYLKFFPEDRDKINNQKSIKMEEIEVDNIPF